MIFVAVGTTHNFDRLVRWVDEAAGRRLLDDDVFAQIGDGQYRPRHLRCATSVAKQEFDDLLARSRCVISHASMGTVTAALAQRKPILVVPRLKRYREAVNDHQVALAEEFARRGHALMARDAAEFFGALEQLRTFVPVPREAQPEAVVKRIAAFLEGVHTKGQANGVRVGS